MKISEILKKKKTISFEVFPPKKESTNITTIYDTIDEIAGLNPDFISVTYGSGGSTVKDTVEIANYIQNKKGITALAHLTGGPSTVDNVKKVCDELIAKKISNIMSLRGDVPVGGCEHFCETFPHASDLNKFIKENYGDTFALGGACYPEVHSEATSMREDLANLLIKQNSGAEFFVTQVFFDNQYFYRLVREARSIGITIPIIAGIMPVVSAKQIVRIIKLSGSAVPLNLRTMLERYMDDKEAMREIGCSFAVNQIIDLLSNDVDGIHIYTMNKAQNIKDIYQAISHIINQEFRG